jgi:RNA polymerase sigma-70 factor, ECF subfamily
MSDAASVAGGSLLALYDAALEDVYGYLLHRCRDVQVAQDLTSETFLVAARASAEGTAPMTVAWLIGVARHKLVDHWRRRSREERWLASVTETDVDEPWEESLRESRAVEALASLGPHHRAALALRYVDDLPVREVATLLERTEHATEALLVRARRAFRRAYEERGDHDR